MTYYDSIRGLYDATDMQFQSDEASKHIHNRITNCWIIIVILNNFEQLQAVFVTTKYVETYNTD